MHQGTPCCSGDSKPPLLPSLLCHYLPLTLLQTAQDYLSPHPDASYLLPEPRTPPLQADLGMLLQTMQSVNPTPIHLPSTLVTFPLVSPAHTHTHTHTYTHWVLLLPEVSLTQASVKPDVEMSLSPPQLSDRESQPTGVKLQNQPQEEGRALPRAQSGSVAELDLRFYPASTSPLFWAHL